MKAAIYARVSTNDQHNEIQIEELADYITRRGWMLAGVYQDHMSGAKARRPGVDSLMGDARLHKFDAIVVWKLDRFGRSLIDLVGKMTELESCGVRFISASQAIDTDKGNPTSRLLTHILAAVAEFERELIRERVSVGLKHAKSKGTAIGRPRRVFDRQKALDMRQQGMSYPAIARALGIGYGTAVRGLDTLSKTRPEGQSQLIKSKKASPSR